MPTRQNRYFNNPQMAAAFSNLAGIFAPPSAQDFLMQAKTEGVDAQNDRLAQLFAAAGGDFDRMGMASGQWNPNQSFYAVDQGNAVTMRGQDIGAQTARRGQDMSLAQAYATNNLTGEQAIPGLSPEIAEALGLGFDLPAVSGQDIGAPRAQPSLTQVQGGVLEDAIAQGIFGPQDMADIQRSGINVATVMGEDGNPMNVNRADSIGMAVPDPQRSAAQRVSYRTPDGSTGTAVFDPNTRQLTDVATGAVLPEGTITGNIQDTVEGLGGTTTTVNREIERFTSASQAIDVIADLRERLRDNPGAVGIAGSLQRLVQNLAATLDETSQAFGGRTPTFEEMVQSGSAQVLDDTGQDMTDIYFNPALPEIQLLTNQVIWSYVSAQQGSGRVSNQQLEEAKQRLGADQWLSNNRALTAALDIMSRDLERVRTRSAATGFVPESVLGAYGTGQSVGPAGAPQQMTGQGATRAPRATNPETGETLEWNGQAWVPVQ